MDTVGPYNRGFREFTEAYEAFGFAQIHADAVPFLPERPGLVLDVGAGSGRDAAWFAERGAEVIAVEPAGAMRQGGAMLHPSGQIRWFDDRLPALSAVHRLGLAFDVVWLSGVWMHVPPDDRQRAMRKLATLLKPGGRMVITLRHGPAPDDRPMWPVDAHEVERLGLEFGLSLRVATERRDDLQRRPGVRWQTVILDLPDDGGSALPLLRGVILRQEKAATYKLALLRAIARIADVSPNVARDADDCVELPLGLVALYWLRMFKPLLERGLPQMPERSGAAPSSAREPFRALGPVAAYELRPGAVFPGEAGDAMRRALADAARTIAQMPATHLTYANDTPVFPTAFGGVPARGAAFAVTEEPLWTYGVTRVPLPVWHALLRMSAWIEPMLVAEWVRLTLGYAEKAGRSINAGEVMAALRWVEPERDTRLVRDLTLRRLAAGGTVHCVWSGRALSAGTLDIDHCLPWSAWSCNDLWNLLPTSRAVNQKSKRERLVTAPALASARSAILDWWADAYRNDDALRVRFAEEVRTSLPVAKRTDPDPEEVFAALEFRRLRLHQDTLLPEWRGMASAP
ncbi:methyltransferase domain-containing protein [Elioraea sp.]|uniref:methyltransferase domain-containing protein n=1 Tax=Elioraea sp. TaxID=2185103 RepID=UPI0025C0FEBD|nr:methyltransferase domain-containing protein [Elioraea sp.]